MSHRSLENSIRDIMAASAQPAPIEEAVEETPVEEEVEQVKEQNCGCGQNPCKTYGKVEEKTLTPAEKKKREEVAKAIERDNPKMPMDKKMAIATATAKKVAEERIPGLMQRVINKDK